MPISILTPVGKERGLKATLTYAYDALGRKTEETDANGVVKGFTYDDAGNVLTNTIRKSKTSPVQLIMSAKYDLAGRMVSQTDANGNKTTIRNNAFRLPSVITYPGDDTIKELNVYTQYDVKGRKAKEWSTAGKTQLWTYDQADRETSHTIKSNKGNDAVTTAARYDLIGNKRFVVDGNGNEQELVYDKLGRQVASKVSVTDSVNGISEQITSIAYDKNGNKMSETDWLGNDTTFVYDDRNRLIQQKDAEGAIVQKLEYNLDDAQIRSWDALNQLTQYRYDKNIQQIATIDAAGYKSGQFYDNAGLKTSQYDGKGNVTKYSYDLLGNLSAVTNAKGEVTSYTYDLLGNKLTQTNGNNHTITYVYNARNLLAAQLDHSAVSVIENKRQYDETKIERYTYTADGSMLSMRDRNGNTTKFVYDAQSRLISKTVEGEQASKAKLNERQVKFTYDGNGNQTSMTDTTGITTRVFDELNRVVSKSVPKLGTVVYRYDLTEDLSEGHRQEVTTDVKGNIAFKTFDRANRLIEVKSGDDLPVKYTYYANGSQKSVEYPNGVKEVYTYTKLNQLAKLQNYVGSTLLDEYTYSYDQAGNQIAKIEMVQGENKGQTSYTYDELNRLLSVNESSGKKTVYTYDGAGNREQETVKEGTTIAVTSYVYNDQNRLIETNQLFSEGRQEKTTYQYDNNGNMTGKNREIIKQVNDEETEPSFGMFIYGQQSENPNVETLLEGIGTYEYDVWNQLSKSTAGSVTSSYRYNAEGYRTYKKVGKSETHYLYEADKVVLETSGSGVETAVNLYGTNLVSRTMGSEKYYYLYNGHADVIALIDETGFEKVIYDYDAFGNSIFRMTSGADINNPIRYAGYQYDEESKLYYLNARYYDPKLARFITEDTYKGEIEDPLSLNFYTYVYNNPLKYTDPSGHDAVIITAAFGAFGGGHTSLLLQDEVGDWYYTFYGDTKVVSVKVDSKVMESLDNLNEWLQQDESSTQYYDKNYTSSTYIKGDFTDSLDLLDELAQGYTEKYGTGKNKDYNLLSNNCVEISWKALQKGTLTDGTRIGDFVQTYPNDLIPNKFSVWAKGEFKNNAYTYKKYNEQIESFIKDNEKKSKSEWYNFWYGKDTFLNNIKIGKQLLG
ncbi:hypothetical protein GOM71_23225 [Paenibacillus sp. NEAU-GSW1]|nr:hypothetical protein [Paenibacillus sp. NEAU-GSW1]